MERVKLIIVIAAVLISRRAHADGALCIQANATNLALMCGGTTAATAESTYNSLLNDSAVATCDQGAASASVSIDGCGNSVNAVETVLGKGYDQFVCAVKGDTNIVNFTASGNNSAIVNVTGSANHVTGAQAGANDANISINGGLAAVAISQGGGGSVNLTSSGNKNLATVTQLSGATAANLSFAGDNGQVTLLQKVESLSLIHI